MAEISGTQDVKPESAGRLRTLNLEPGRAELAVVGIKTHNFENLVTALVPLIETVTTHKDGSLAVTFTKEPAWDTGIVPSGSDVKAGVALVARSATYMAARLKLANGDIPAGLTIEMRELDVNATKFLTKSPWFTDENATQGLRPISVVEALRADPEYLKSELKPVKSKLKLGASLGALSATALACGLAGSGPAAITAEVPTPGFTEIAPIPAESITLEAVNKGVDRWKTFSDGTHTATAVGSDMQVLVDGATGKTAEFHPVNADGTLNMDITHEVISKKYTYAGDPTVYTLPFLVTYDGVHHTLTVDPAQEASVSGGRTVLEILTMRYDGKVFDTGTALVITTTAQGMAFTIEKGTTLESTLAVVDSAAAKPRTVIAPQSVDAVLHLSDNGPPIAPTGTAEVPTATATATATATSEPTATAVPTETAVPVNLGTEQKHVSCDPTTDFKKDGKIFKAEQEVLKNYKPAEGAVNTGYEPSYVAHWWLVSLSKGSHGVVGEPISFCDVTGDFMGLPGIKFTVFGIPWLNKDDTISVVHILINKSASDGYFDAIKKLNGTGFDLVQFIPDDWKKQYGNMQGEQLYAHLYEAEDPDLIFKLLGQVKDTGNIPEELQNELILALHSKV